ncbi:hypothetical protein M3Y97_00916300 [Aphelenchoides bicaudatus]|nr:hypothetical protein M3Y97_00916300 [Aphelenchoides bicaudatus]
MGKESEVKMASMSGHHVRTLKDLNSAQGLALNAENGQLIASFPDGELKNFNIQTHAIEDEPVFDHGRVFFFNCNPHSLELQTKFFKRVCQDNECHESKTKSKLVLQNLNEVQKVFGPDVGFTNSPAILIIDKTPKTNLCKEEKCKELCVIGEAYPDPVAECISTTSNQLKQVAKVEIRIESNPLNAFLLVLVILFACVIIAGVALIISSRLRIELRNLIARTFGKSKSTSFGNPTRPQLNYQFCHR